MKRCKRCNKPVDCGRSWEASRNKPVCGLCESLNSLVSWEPESTQQRQEKHDARMAGTWLNSINRVLSNDT